MIGENPLVSVIIPTYNRAHLLGRAIQSVLDQTFEDYELIVVDDASTDDTEEIVNAFSDPRLRYVRHGENRGAPAARNTGIQVSNGAYVGFLDSDDAWHPEKLDRQIRKFQEGGAKLGVVCCHVRGLSPSGAVARICSASGNVLEQALTFELIGCITSSMLIRVAALNQICPLDESLPGCQDTDLKIALSTQWEFDFVDEVLVFKGEGHPRISTSAAKDVARRLVIEKYDHLYQRFPVHVKRRAWAKHYYEMGRRSLVQQKAWGQGMIAICRSVLLSPALVMSMVTKYGQRRVTALRRAATRGDMSPGQICHSQRGRGDAK